jgi:hypothetical protein
MSSSQKQVLERLLLADNTERTSLLVYVSIVVS